MRTVVVRRSTLGLQLRDLTRACLSAVRLPDAFWSRPFAVASVFAAAIFINGCASNTGSFSSGNPVVSVPAQVTANGSVHGGQQPVSGATIQLWQVGTTGYGQGATALGSATVTTALGNFNFATDYSCSSTPNGNNTLVYLTASGGNPGLASGTNNNALSMMVALGTCGNLATTFVEVNEVTAVASTFALAQFIGPTGGVGTYASSPQGLTNAFANVNNLVNIGNGKARVATPNGNGVVPQAELNTLGDILAPCVNSPGASSAECSSLFSLTTPAGGTAPTTTMGAALNIALNPGLNVANLLAQATPASPFQPSLTSTNDWTMAIGYASGGTSARSVAADAAGNIWVSNYGSGGTNSSLSLVSPTGVPASNSPYANAASVNGASGLALDVSNDVWLANHDNSSAMEFNATTSGSVLTIAPVGSPLTSVGLNSPIGVGIDPSGNLWFANNGNNSVTSLAPTCTTTACATNYTGGGLSGPQSIALDSSGIAWVTNVTGASVTRIVPGIGPLPYTGGGLTNPAGLAIDGSTDIWITDSGISQLSELNSDGAALSPGTGLTGGGISSSLGVAVDGAGNIWVANAGGNSLSEFSTAGTAVSPSTGYQGGALSYPSAVTIDLSGNLWVTSGSPVTFSGQTVTLTEFIGLAAPTITPLAQAVTIGQLGQEPGAPPIVKLPKASAGGPYSGTASQAIKLSGASSTDPKDETLTYAWTFGDGSAGTGATPSHNYLNPGTYVVTLIVTNSDGKSSAPAVASVTVGSTTVVPPVANAGGPYSGTAYTALSFTGLLSSDPANKSLTSTGLTFTWNFGDGGTGSGPTPVHTYTAAGTFAVTLTVQSLTSGATATGFSSATIASGTPTAGAPTVNANGPYKAAAGTAINFSSAGSSDPNSLPLSYSWQFGDGNTSTAQNPVYTYGGSGVYSVILSVSNGTSQVKTATTATITSPVLPALTANAGGPYTVAINQPVTMSAAATTNPSSRQLNYTWDFGDGTTGTGVSPVHVYTKAGTYTVNLNVNDGLSANGNATTTATVTGPVTEAINANIGGPYQNTAYQAITFNATASTDNLGNPLTFAWTYGDGGTDTGPTPTHTYKAVGTYTVTLTVSSATASASASTSVPITAAINVAITTPAANTIFASNLITVSGTTNNPNLSVVVNGVTAAVSGTNFTATGVSLREGVNLISATATDGQGGVGTGVVSVILDVTPPVVSITSPAAGATVSSSTIAVAGLVNDSVTGTIGSNDVTVTVNGQPALVSNRSYLLSNVQLVPGTNTLTVVATDKVGNTVTKTQTIQLLPATAQLSLLKVSGDSQTGAVKSAMGSPLVVQLVSGAGSPVAGRPVTFTVTRSDGMVEVLPTIGQSIAVTTDSNGKASVLFQLGTRTGLGINQVSATTPGVAAPALFTATSTGGTPTQIVAVRGDNQRGLLGQPLAQGFQVMVEDAYGNPASGVTVNFASSGASDGTLDNPAPVTDINGKAIATLTLGQQEGISNYAYSASFPGQTASPVSFIASAYPPGPTGMTSVSGLVLDNTNTPVPNATVTIAGTTLRTVTNASGNFTLNGAPVGTVTLTVDGSTATSTQTFPFLSFVLQDLPGQNNTLGKPVYLPSIDINDAQTVGGSEPVTLTLAGVPGLAFTVAPNSVTFPDGSTVGKMSLSQVKSDLVPMEPSNGTQPAVVWTLQPAGAKFSVPLQMTVPNMQALAPGAVTEIYQYDHDLEQFVSVGTGHVSADGSVINSDPGFGITKAGWSHCCTPTPPPICAESCDSNNPCVSIFEVAGCECGSEFVDGVACHGIALNQMQCMTQGYCQHGLCIKNHNKGDGTNCDNGIYCETDECKSGVCVGTPIPDVQQMPTKEGSPGTLSFQASFDTVGESMKSFFTAFGIPLSVTPTFNISSQTILSCCESTKTMNVPSTTDGVTIGVTISAPNVTPVINGIPLAFTPPKWTSLGTQGIILGFSGSIGGNVSVKLDRCLNTTCASGGASVGVSGSGTFQLGSQSVAYANLIISSGITGSLTAGCGVIEGKISWDGIKLSGTLTAAQYFQANYTTQLVNYYVVYDNSVPW